MRDDADFSGYVTARWPSLVRTLVLVGCPAPLAPDVALDGLARCQSDWSTTRRTDDVDVVVHRALLEAWDDWRRTPWWRDLTADALASGDLPAELVDALDRLDADVRNRLVLERHADLLRSQAAAATSGNHAGTLPDLPTAEQLRAGVEAIDVLAPPAPETVTGRDRDRRRRRAAQRTRRTLAVAVPVATLVAGVAWWTSQPAPADTDLAAVHVDVRQNSAAVAWYADGMLQLEHVVLDLPGVRQFEPIWAGAAYGDEQGRVVYVSNAGTRTLLGRKHPAVPLVVSDSRGWIAWVTADDTRPRLQVHQLSSSSTLASRDLVPPEQGEEVRPVAVDGDTLFYVDGAGAHAWTVTSGEMRDVPTTGLLDAGSQMLVSQPMPGLLNVAEQYAEAGFVVPGAGAELSADADLVLTRDTTEQDSFGPVLIYDTATGADLSVGLGPDDVALAAELGPGRTVTYIVARAQDRPENADFLRSSFSGQLELRTCDVSTRECEALERFPSTRSRPLLAY